MSESGSEYKVAIIGNGWVGGAYHKMFPDAVIYDEPQIIEQAIKDGKLRRIAIESGRKLVNECDMAIVAVPTNLTPDQTLDGSIVEDVVSWIDTPYILIKSALQPGTTDFLVRKYNKKIATSVEMVGEGKYYVNPKYPDPVDPTKHDFIIVGGEEETARRCADFLWRKMSPDVSIHLVSAVEAEITKMMENTWGAMKVTFANTIYDICERYGANYTKVLQAWGADGRTEKMHMRVVPFKRGWVSKCYDKDVPALAKIDESGFIQSVVDTNKRHLKENG